MVQTMGWLEGIDGTELYFQTHGEATDRPPFIFCDGVGCAGYVWKYIIRDFSGDFRMLQWNYRATAKAPCPGKKVILPSKVWRTT